MTFFIFIFHFHTLTSLTSSCACGSFSFLEASSNLTSASLFFVNICWACCQLLYERTRSWKLACKEAICALSAKNLFLRLPLRLSRRQSLSLSTVLFQNYNHPDDHTRQTTDTPGFNPFTIKTSFACQIIDKMQ